MAMFDMNPSELMQAELLFKRKDGHQLQIQQTQVPTHMNKKLPLL